MTPEEKLIFEILSLQSRAIRQAAQQLPYRRTAHQAAELQRRLPQTPDSWWLVDTETVIRTALSSMELPQPLKDGAWTLEFCMEHPAKAAKAPLVLREHGRCAGKKAVERYKETYRYSDYTVEEEETILKRFNEKLDSEETWDLLTSSSPVTDLSGTKVFKDQSSYLFSPEHSFDRSFLNSALSRRLHKDMDTQYINVQSRSVYYDLLYALGEISVEDGCITALRFAPGPAYLALRGNAPLVRGESSGQRLQRLLPRFHLPIYCAHQISIQEKYTSIAESVFFLRETSLPAPVQAAVCALLCGKMQREEEPCPADKPKPEQAAARLSLGRLLPVKQRLADIAVVASAGIRCYVSNENPSQAESYRRCVLEALGTLSADDVDSPEDAALLALESCAFYAMGSQDSDAVKSVLSAVTQMQRARELHYPDAELWWHLLEALGMGLLLELDGFRSEECRQVLEAMHTGLSGLKSIPHYLDAQQEYLYALGDAICALYRSAVRMTEQRFEEAAAILQPAFARIIALPVPECGSVCSAQQFSAWLPGALACPIVAMMGRNLTTIRMTLEEEKRCESAALHTQSWIAGHLDSIPPRDTLAIQAQVLETLASISISRNHLEEARERIQSALSMHKRLKSIEHAPISTLRYLWCLRTAVTIMSAAGDREQVHVLSGLGVDMCRGFPEGGNATIHKLYPFFEKWYQKSAPRRGLIGRFLP